MSISNEKIKLTANFVNGLGVTAIALGAFGPMVKWLTAANSTTHLGIVLLWFICGIFAHNRARSILDDLEDEWSSIRSWYYGGYPWFWPLLLCSPKFTFIEQSKLTGTRSTNPIDASIRAVILLGAGSFVTPVPPRTVP